MTDADLAQMFLGVRQGSITIDDAVSRVRQSTGMLDYATVDLQRAQRCGFPEVVFGEGKTSAWIEGVLRTLQDAKQEAFVTRLNAEQTAHLQKAFPDGRSNPLARTFHVPTGENSARVGLVQVVTAGTSDLPVAEEALETVRVMGAHANLITDVGVAGIHRVLRQRDVLNAADVVIVVAGMDGALPSVVGGLVDCPVIAVPTSIGYGAAFGGLAALLTMLNSCSAGVAVVNIDAGFKAGYVAARMVRRMQARPTPAQN